ncbi:uncharacterized protein AMSG_05913 [Thecamonas trahens ATCC 50062]|uniref:SH3 domain-containing protein n=1 Tax=Thecamonas trahens ATCC 50062 TaxID=461836 RepID=A0A0L0DFQ3_THETB|nr:hypothetical protein AMSG_05913 [Thecamonas trahens ATCC 50062]KNC50138.1 hypothetical protein AMSG_05913 [Thecamonas trahens ATCC 50062]|eukprot:XP_013757295.1 hypothetical protein AMSG_05913 [Thecamonas trahens ATCC 50062]
MLYVMAGGGALVVLLVAVVIILVVRSRRSKPASYNVDDAAVLEMVSWSGMGASPGTMSLSTMAAPTRPAPAPDATAAPAMIRTMRYAFSGKGPDELTCSAGDRVEVLEEYDDGWCTARNLASGMSGVVPGNYLS